MDGDRGCRVCGHVVYGRTWALDRTDEVMAGVAEKAGAGQRTGGGFRRRAARHDGAVL